MLGPSWKNHFTLAQFYPFYERPVTFIVSQWQYDKSKPNIKYFVYRISVFSIFFTSWIFSIVNEKTFDGSTKWPIYLTNWGYTLCTVQALIICVMVVVSCLSSRISNKQHWQHSVLKIYPVYWVVNIIATPVAFTITIIYWSIIYNAERAKLDVMNFLVHGCNSLLMFLDIWIVFHPVQILHFFYPLALAVIYTIFTVIYYAAGGVSKDGSRYIYPILKWDQPGTTILVCLGVVAFMIFLHLFTYVMYRLRVKLYNFLYLSEVESSKSSPTETKGYINEVVTTETV